MFKAHIENSIEKLRDKLNFESAEFVEDPKDALSQIEETQIVAYYSRDIQIRPDLEACNRGFAVGYFDLIALVPPCYNTEAVIWNIYSFLDAEITAISTDSNQIHKEIYKTEIRTDFKLIRFSAQIGIPIHRIDCCMKMKDEC